MSQAGITSVGSSGGGAVLSLTGNTGGAVGPDGTGTINVLGATGISVDGNAGTFTETISLSNYSNLTATTTDATPNSTMTIALGAVAGCYSLDVNVSVFDVTDSLGAGFSVFSSIRTTGAAAVLIDNSDLIANTEGAMSAVNCSVQVSANNAVIQVTGLAGKTIHWRAITYYTFVS